MKIDSRTLIPQQHRLPSVAHLLRRSVKATPVTKAEGDADLRETADRDFAIAAAHSML